MTDVTYGLAYVNTENTEMDVLVFDTTDQKYALSEAVDLNLRLAAGWDAVPVTRKRTTVVDFVATWHRRDEERVISTSSDLAHVIADAKEFKSDVPGAKVTIARRTTEVMTEEFIEF